MIGPGLGLRADVISADWNAQEVAAKTSAFLKEDSPTRVLFASEVLGMGVDIKGLYRVWVLGQPGSLKEFAQLFGRCGRDRKYSEAILFTSDNKQAFKCDSDMQKFCDSASCLRMILAKYFIPNISETIIRRGLQIPHGATQCCCVCASNEMSDT